MNSLKINNIDSTKIGRYLNIITHAKNYKERIKNELKLRLENEPTKKQIKWCYQDYLKFYVKYRGSLETDYFGTNLYLKSDFIRQNSFATYQRNIWRNSIQDEKYWPIFYNKTELYQNFPEFLNRKYMIITDNTRLEDINKFIKDCSNKIMSKVSSGTGGKGVKYWDFSKKKNINDFMEYYPHNIPMVIEEIVEQSEDLHSFSNFGSVNTLRIVTIVDENGTPHVASAGFRIGLQKSIVDNFSSGGMAAPIDIDTGIIFHPAINKMGKEFIIHPDSKKQIVGYQIPDWDNYKKFALKLAKKFPTMRYVGWDIVKSKTGKFVMIEGNKDAGVDYLENGLLYGMLPIYNKILKGKSK